MDHRKDFVALPDSPKAFSRRDVFCITALIKHLHDWTNDEIIFQLPFHINVIGVVVKSSVRNLKDSSSNLHCVQLICNVIIFTFFMIIITMTIISISSLT